MLLAIDTSTRYGGVALSGGDGTLASYCWYSLHNHTAELAPAIDHILEVSETGPAGLDAVAVALGPGGFSALRVGISAAKGLALALNIPVVGVGTLEMQAYPYADTGMPICPLLEAGRGEVAAAIFQASQGRWKKLQDERVCTPEELVESISKPTIFCGESVENHRKFLQQALGDKAAIVGFSAVPSRLWALAALAAERLRQQDTDNLAALQPLYLRKPSIGPPETPQKVRA